MFGVFTLYFNFVELFGFSCLTVGIYLNIASDLARRTKNFEVISW